MQAGAGGALRAAGGPRERGEAGRPTRPVPRCKAAGPQGGLRPDPSGRSALESPRRGRRKRGVRATAAAAGAEADSEPESAEAVASAQLVRCLPIEAS